MSGRHTPGKSGFFSDVTFDDVIYTIFSILCGCLVMMFTVTFDPHVDRAVLTLLGTVFAHLPFSWYIILGELKPEHSLRSINRPH